jgi:hypothetical protein
MSVESSAVKSAARAARKHSSETKEKVRAWAPVIGLRAAARKFQVNEDTACWWAHREKWVLPAVFAQTRIRNASKQAQSITHGAQDEILREQSEQTMLYMSSAALKASYAAAQSTGNGLMIRDNAQALEAHSCTADRVHGWSASRQSAPNVAVQVNVPMPTAEEREEMNRLDRKLDAFSAMLKERRQLHKSRGRPGGRGCHPTEGSVNAIQRRLRKSYAL